MIGPEFANRRILMLQGPVGPFFRRLAEQLRRHGARVTKVNFNGGDEFFFPDGVRYQGPMNGIGDFLLEIVRREAIDTVVLFGDCRPVHGCVHELAADCGLDLRVFEEGYFRPAFITCERFGVNGRSGIPSDPQFYRDLAEPLPVPELPPSRNAFFWMGLWSVLYYVASAVRRRAFRHYQHHRPLNVFGEGGRWLLSGFRKQFYRAAEAGVQKRLCSELSGRFFLAPLQVHNDAQVVAYSDYGDVTDFIAEVVRSFAANADQGDVLVFKHHPMDRAYRDYTTLVGKLAARYNVEDRVLYIHDQHLPTLLRHAKGAVVINSTVGLSAIHEGVPTTVMGRAFYDFAGLTWQGPLDRFWSVATEAAPDPGLYRQFRAWVIRHTQLNDNFYAPIRPRSAVEASAPQATAGNSQAECAA